MKKSTKRAQCRYRYKQRPLNMASKIFHLMDNPPESLRFTQSDKTALMEKFDQLITIWRAEHDFGDFSS